MTEQQLRELIVVTWKPARPGIQLALASLSLSVGRDVDEHELQRLKGAH